MAVPLDDELISPSWSQIMALKALNQRQIDMLLVKTLTGILERHIVLQSE